MVINTRVVVDLDKTPGTRVTITQTVTWWRVVVKSPINLQVVGGNTIVWLATVQTACSRMNKSTICVATIHTISILKCTTLL